MSIWDGDQFNEGPQTGTLTGTPNTVPVFDDEGFLISSELSLEGLIIAASQVSLAAQVETNTADILVLNTYTASLSVQIGANTADIVTNAVGISGLTTTVNSVAAHVTQNSADIVANGTGITGLTTTVNSVAANVSVNTGSLASLTTTVNSVAAHVTVNTADIVTNSSNINTLTATVNSVATHVTQNSADIITNTSAISSLTTTVNSVAVHVTQNTADIVTNTAGVTSNTSSISALTITVNSVAAHVTVNTTDIVTHTAAIATNTAAITKLTTVTSDSTTTGASATLQAADILGGVVRLTNASLVSVSGIPAGSAGQRLIVENQTTATIAINNYDGAVTAASRIYTGTGANVSQPTNSSFEYVYDAVAAAWMLVGGTGSGTGSVGGTKNYLAAYTASTSSNVPNTGNGNFELGNTNGWGLITTTLTGVYPTGSIAANAATITTFAASNSQNIGGAYSLYTASTGSIAAGQGFASSSFFIDAEDQAKPITISGYFKVVSGASNLNLSGTSSNSWAIWVYDVTNSAWIMPAGSYSMTQGTGVGRITATFQTSASGTQYRLVLVCVNATAGASAIAWDDFTFGPQPVVVGVPASDPVIYSLTPGATTTSPTKGGTIVIDKATWSRFGSEMIWTYTFGQTSAGTAGSGIYLFPLPAGLSMDPNFVSFSTSNTGIVGTALGYGQIATTGSINSNYAVTGCTVYARDANNLFVVAPAAAAQQSSTVGSTYFGLDTNPVFYSFTARFKIAGWSSNTVMSSDTDTRVTAASCNTLTSTTYTAGQNLKFTTTSFDTHGALTVSTGEYKAPSSGIYDVYLTGVLANSSPGAFDLFVYVDGVQKDTIATAGTAQRTSGAIPVQANSGQLITIRGTASGVFLVTSGVSFAVSRRSGPAVVAASDSVNGSYTDTAAGSINSSALTTYTYGTKIKDSQNAYSSGVLTIPSPGEYRFSAQATTAAISPTTSQKIQLAIVRNGTVIMLDSIYGNGASSIPYTVGGSVSYPCLQGDTISVQLFYSNSGATLGTGAGFNTFCWERVGN